MKPIIINEDARRQADSTLLINGYRNTFMFFYFIISHLFS